VVQAVLGDTRSHADRLSDVTAAIRSKKGQILIENKNVESCAAQFHRRATIFIVVYHYRFYRLQKIVFPDSRLSMFTLLDSQRSILK
jgi:hypothetical protein